MFCKITQAKGSKRALFTMDQRFALADAGSSKNTLLFPGDPWIPRMRFKQLLTIPEVSDECVLPQCWETAQQGPEFALSSL